MPGIVGRGQRLQSILQPRQGSALSIRCDAHNRLARSRSNGLADPSACTWSHNAAAPCRSPASAFSAAARSRASAAVTPRGGGHNSVELYNGGGAGGRTAACGWGVRQVHRDQVYPGGRGLIPPRLIPVPALPAGGSSDDEQGDGDDDAGMALQKLLGAFGAKFLIDFVENVDHLVLALC